MSLYEQAEQRFKDRQEANNRGFSDMEDFYAYRLRLKRLLRIKGIDFDSKESTDSLEAKQIDTLPSPIADTLRRL